MDCEMICSVEKNVQVDLTEFEDFTVPEDIDPPQKNKLDPEDPTTWTPEYCVKQSLELMYIRHEMQDIIAKNVEDFIRNKHSKLSFQIPRTLFRVNKFFIKS